MDGHIKTITAAILKTTSTPEEIVEMAYELGVSHGKSQEAERRKAMNPGLATRKCIDPAETIAINTKFRSDAKAHWFVWLTKHYGRVSYEPRKFVVFFDGKRRTYKPDYRCILDNGSVIWVESKRAKWLQDDHSYWESEFRQARAMQQTVKSHKIKLYVCTGDAGNHTTWQVLGLDVLNPRDPMTLVRAELPERDAI